MTQLATLAIPSAKPDPADLRVVAGDRCSTCQHQAGFVAGRCVICGEPPRLDANDLEDAIDE